MCIVSEGANTNLVINLNGVSNVVVSSPCPVIRDVQLAVIQKQWREDEITVDEEISQVYSMKFKKPLKRIMHINGQPYDWAYMGITQNKRLEDSTLTGYLDFSNFSLAATAGEGTISGKIIFEYFS